MPKKIFFFILTLALLFPLVGYSAEKHRMTDIENTTRSRPTVPPIWADGKPELYTQHDSDTDKTQAYLLVHDPALSTPTEIFSETRLTKSDYDKSNLMFGPDATTKTVNIYDDSGATVIYSGNCYFFVYTTDAGTGGDKNLYLGCIDAAAVADIFSGSASATCPTGTMEDMSDCVYEMPLTGVGSITSYDVEDYDIDLYQGNTLTLTDSSDPMPYDADQIVFTTSDNELHYLTFDIDADFNLDTGNDLLEIDGGTTITAVSLTTAYGTFSALGYSWWTAASIFTDPKYRMPRFFNSGVNIAVMVSAYETSDVWQLASFGMDGTNETSLTNTGHDYYDPRTVSLSDEDIIVFGAEGDGSSTVDQLAYLRLQTDPTLTSISSWCGEVKMLTLDNDFNRLHHTVGYISTIGTSSSTATFNLAFDLEQLDGYHDIYYGEHELSCTGTSSTSAVKSEADNVFKDQIQLTCQMDNSFPSFAVNMNFDSTHLVTKSPALGIMYLETRLDISDATQVHLFDIAEPATCEDTCYENADGTPITDADGDGLHDTRLEADGTACDKCEGEPDQGDSDGNGIDDACEEDCGADSDGDGIGDECDNCPETYNPDQADLDGDGKGDWCDNCIIVSNADQTDTDGDGIGDACESECESCCCEGDGCPDEDTCFDGGLEDTDGDGIDDACDNCPNDDNWNQNDKDGNGVGDACEETGTPSVTDCLEAGGSIVSAAELGLDTTDAIILSNGGEVTVEIDGITWRHNNFDNHRQRNRRWSSLCDNG